MDKSSNNQLKIEHSSLPMWNDLPELELYMDQVIVLMEKYLADFSVQDSKLITPSMINNYVKHEIMPAPVKKKYSREHLAYLIIICSLKQVLPLSNIKKLIELKLENYNISEILDLYSKEFDSTFKSISELCLKYFNSQNNESSSIEETSIFAAIAACNCINISNKIFFQNE